MANITVAQFRARFNEFSVAADYPDETIQLYIDDSAAEVDFSKFGARAAKAQAYWVAHYLALWKISQDDASVGATGVPLRRLTAQSEGDSSESYASPGNITIEDEFWSSTSYGQIWLTMLKYAEPAVTSTGQVTAPAPRRLGWPFPFVGR